MKQRCPPQFSPAGCVTIVFSLFGSFVLVFALLSALGFAGSLFCYYLKLSYWEKQVEDLCISEGKITVFHTISRQDLENSPDQRGAVTFVHRAYSDPSHDYAYEQELETINRKSPRVSKIKRTYYRKSDGLILGEIVGFYLAGEPGFSSSYGCSDIDGFDTDVYNKIFKRQ